MKGVRNVVTALLIGSLTPMLVWAASGAALYERRKEKNLLKQASNLTCSIDADCPPGYACVNGRCILQRAQ